MGHRVYGFDTPTRQATTDHRLFFAGCAAAFKGYKQPYGA
jgi:hypothetical protein